MNNKLLALDVSTSTVGISLFHMGGNLEEVNHVSPKGKTSMDTRTLVNADKKGFPNVDLYYLEADCIFNFLKENYSNNILDLIVIEQPMLARENPVSTSQLNIFAGLLFAKLRSYYTCEIKYIDVDLIRRSAFPELLGGKSKSLWGSVPKKILDKKISDFRKHIILSLVAQRFPDIVWLLNNNMNIKKENLDRADAVATGLGYMSFIKKWTPNIQNIGKAVSFAEQCIIYDIFLSKLNEKNLDKDEKNSLKLEYLKGTFKIEEHLNVAI